MNPAEKANAKFTGRGMTAVSGWLILPAAGLLYSFTATVIGVFLGDPDRAVSREVYVFSYLLSLLYIPLYVVLAVKWARRSETLPKWMKIYYGSQAVCSLITAVLIVAAEPEGLDLVKLGANTGVTIAVSLAGWLYFHNSRRVRATFMRQLK